MSLNDKKAVRELLALSERLAEDRLYEMTMAEAEKAEYDPVSRARALEECDGDTDKAKSLYIKHRIRRLKDLLLAERMEKADQQAREREERQRVEIQRREEAEIRKESGMSNFEKRMYRLGKRISK